MPGGRAKLPVLAELSAPAATEAIRSLRRSDLERLDGFRDWLGGRGSVLVTGSGDPARTLAVPLAGVAAAAGLRTILVEADLAQPRLAAELGLSPAPGVHEYLRWEAAAAEVLQPLTLTGPAAADAVHPLVCIVAGRPAADAAVLTGLQSFRHMTAKLRSAYDLVVFAGPVLDAGEAGLGETAAQAEGVIATIGPQAASRRRLRALRASLARLGAEPLGAVVVGEGAA
jgi:polysaccharide biosynthesis transport protein